MFFKYNKDDKIFYEKYGNSKKVILILPGWGNNRRSFHDVINFFKEEYTIYIFDYPGFGNSPLPASSLSIYDYANIIISFMNKLKIKNPIIIGHSFGGRIIITLSGYYKVKFKKIILISSAGIVHKKNKSLKIRKTIYKLLKKISIFLPKRIREKYINILINIFGSKDFKDLDKHLRNTFINIVNEDLTNYLERVNSNVLLIWGEIDESTPLSDAYLMKNSINNSKLIALEKCSHFCYLEEKEKVIDLIYNFIKKD